MRNNLPKGKFGEKQALNFLKAKEYRIIAQNFHCRWGEIDLIGIKNNILVFIEVKTRWGNVFGGVEEAITPRKIKSLVKTANYFKLLHPKTPEMMRIDAVEVKLNKDNKLLDIIHIENITS